MALCLQIISVGAEWTEAGTCLRLVGKWWWQPEVCLNILRDITRESYLQRLCFRGNYVCCIVRVCEWKFCIL